MFIHFLGDKSPFFEDAKSSTSLVEYLCSDESLVDGNSSVSNVGETISVLLATEKVEAKKVF